MEQIIKYSDETNTIIENTSDVFDYIKEKDLEMNLYNDNGVFLGKKYLSFNEKKFLSLIIGTLKTEGDISQKLMEKNITDERVLKMFNILLSDIEPLTVLEEKSIFDEHFKDIVNYLINQTTNNKNLDIQSIYLFNKLIKYPIAKTLLQSIIFELHTNEETVLLGVLVRMIEDAKRIIR